MARTPFKIWGILFAGWSLFAAWQFYSWKTEQFLIRETVRQQAHSVMNALTGGILSHRRLGWFVQQQLNSILLGLAETPDVLAVEVATIDGGTLVAAGEMELLPAPRERSPGEYWDPIGFRLVEVLVIEPGMAGELPARGPGRGTGRGGGQGSGEVVTHPEDPSFDQLRSEGGELITTLVLDRQRTDALLVGAGWSHAIATLAGGLMLIGLGIVWQGNLRLIEERGRSERLELESQHYRDLSQAAAGLAHETRNPLGLVRGWAERITHADATPDERAEQGKMLIEECDRVTARINEFLSFARPTSMVLSGVDPIGLGKELQAILQPDLDAKEMTMTVRSDDSVGDLQADRELLRQALFNLLQNAIQASQPGASIDLCIGLDPQHCGRIDIQDRGPGVAEDQIDSLFSPYFTTRERGAGLGLAIVRRIAVAHHWTASYLPRPGGGSIFRLEGMTREIETDNSDR